MKSFVAATLLLMNGLWLSIGLCLSTLSLAGCSTSTVLNSPSESKQEPVVESQEVLAVTDEADAKAAGLFSEHPHEEAAWFVDRTKDAGIDFQHQRGPIRNWLPEIMGGGAVWIDYDSDGDQDLYFVQGGDLTQTGELPGNQLYQNQGDGTFEEVTQQAGVGDTGYGMGASVGDYDRDGHLDLYVTNVGPNVLYRNQGDGTFDDVSQESGVAHDGWGTASAFVDYDLDGHLDLLLINYIRWSPETEGDCRTNNNVQDYCSPLHYQAPAMDVLYRNRGDGTFEDVTLKSGIGTAYGNGLGAVVADFNADGRIDFYVANDGTPNQLWLQDKSGEFRDRSLLMGCAVNGVGAAEAGMGVVAFDVESDGDLDLLMTHLGKETNTLYVNQGKFFDDRTAAARLAAPSFAYTGFGLAVGDLNQDGLLDLYIANGRVGRNRESLLPGDPFAEPNQLFSGVGGGQFDEQLPAGGTSTALVETSRAVAVADYDLDGDLDLLVVNNGGQARLLENQIGPPGSSLRFRVLDSFGRDAVGAMVGLLAGDQWMWRTVGPAAGYLSGHEPHVHFGLRDGQLPQQIKVLWPDGTQSTHSEIRRDRVIQQD